ncbi:hypothetical protein EYF80_009360 [Liparis tanakae]|uniref:Uncharacterized protein n=1 Tax=Liparis tanakae TaxID=230148 RepID=A0A4Z2IR64_9TELE|nr:hypothetical protein EYF80_009360 [Liparis tanakae]
MDGIKNNLWREKERKNISTCAVHRVCLRLHLCCDSDCNRDNRVKVSWEEWGSPPLGTEPEVKPEPVERSGEMGAGSSSIHFQVITLKIGPIGKSSFAHRRSIPDGEI